MLRSRGRDPISIDEIAVGTRILYHIQRRAATPPIEQRGTVYDYSLEGGDWRLEVAPHQLPCCDSIGLDDVIRILG